MKTCPICGKPFTQGKKFQKYCIPAGNCYKEATRRKARQWYHDHREAVLKRAKKIYRGVVVSRQLDVMAVSRSRGAIAMLGELWAGQP